MPKDIAAPGVAPAPPTPPSAPRTAEELDAAAREASFAESQSLVHQADQLRRKAGSGASSAKAPVIPLLRN